MKRLARHFIRRRKWDSRLLALGGAAMPLRHGITPVVTLFFSAVGVYLVAIGHGGARRLAPWFVGLGVAYLAWSLFLIVMRGEPFLDNRQVTYSLMIGMSAFIANGLVLVRDPLRFFVVGSRIGVVGAILASLSYDLIGQDRVGLGGNPAPFAMVAAICMIAAIIPVRRAPRWAPNSVLYALLGAVPIYYSETRALLVIVPLVLVVEYVVWLRPKPLRLRLTGLAAGAGLAAALLAAGPVHGLVERLFMPAVLYYTGQNVEWEGSISGDIRLSLWQGALASIAQQPLAGYGDGRMADVIARAPAMHEQLVQMRHAHNMFLDEALLHGLPGLVILVGLLAAGFHHILKYAGDAATRRNALYVLAAILSYGSLHNPFLHETTICGIFLYMGVMIAGAARDRSRARMSLRASAGR
jgi:O-antigen ligase